MPNGSSAVYGSDAIAGVVNIILRKNFEGLEVNAKYSSANSIDQTDASIAWGKRFDKGSISIIGSALSRGELDTQDRGVTANAPGAIFPTCNPGNVFSLSGNNLPGLNSPYAAVPKGFTGTPSIQEFQGPAGKLNECSLAQGTSLIPRSNRYGVFASGNYALTESVELFTELMVSRVLNHAYAGYVSLFGEQGYQSYTVGATNPFNPFGTAVGVSYLFTTLPRYEQFSDTTFFRPLVGARGTLFDTWKWEIATWESRDQTNETDPMAIYNSSIQTALDSPNPATALNPFTAGSIGSPSVLQTLFSTGYRRWEGREQAANGFIRGPLYHLPAGPIQLVVGGEYDSDLLYSDDISGELYAPGTQETFTRHHSAVFAEARIPIVGNPENPQAGDVLAVNFAGRHDHYDDFGGKNTPQVGIEWRPVDTLLVRGNYAQTFKAPPLFNLYSAQIATPATGVFDPLTGKEEFVNLVTGGNPSPPP